MGFWEDRKKDKAQRADDDNQRKLIAAVSSADPRAFGNFLTLLYKGDINAAVDGVTPMMAAEQRNNPDIIAALIKHGAKPPIQDAVVAPQATGPRDAVFGEHPQDAVLASATQDSASQKSRVTKAPRPKL